MVNIRIYVLSIISHLQVRNRMRLFITLKEQGVNIESHRIQIQDKQKSTQFLIEQLRRALRIPKHTLLIIRLCVSKKNVKIFHKNSNNQPIKLRILPGWPLSHYGIASGNQLEIQIVSDKSRGNMLTQTSQTLQKCSVNQQQHINNSPVVFKKTMKSIKQECDEDQQNQYDINKLVLEKYQDLLKILQKGNSGRFLKQIKCPHKSLDTCQNQYYQQQIINIMHQYGQKGWASIHYAVYAGCIQAIQFLISINIDLNMITLDGWTPLQLAITQQNIQVINLLAAQPSLDPNLCTKHGLPLIMAIITDNIQVIKCLTNLQVDISLKDNKQRTVFDYFDQNEKPQINKLICKAGKRYSLNLEECEAFHSLVSLYRGEVIEVRTPPLRDRQIYLVLNPYEMMISMYQNKQKYPHSPRHLIKMRQTTEIIILQKSDRSWYMKSSLTYFAIMNHSKKLGIYAVNFLQTAENWKNAHRLCLQNISNYTSQIHKFNRNETPIMDRIQIETNCPQKDKDKNFIMKLFTDKFDDKTENQTINTVDKTIGKVVDKSGSTSHSIGKQQKIKQQQTVKIKKEQSLVQNKISHNQLLLDSLKFSDFEILKILGEGAFGTVYLARDIRNPQINNSQDFYALKCFKKKKLIINKQIKYTIAQLSILKQLCHPYIVNLHFTFQTPNYVYLGLDYCSGKDLSHHLIQQITFNEQDCKIYAAQILLALEYLHSKNIIYRDLKPQNIMLAKDGHIKLVDFGLSKQGKDANFVAKSFCGSPAYISPQMLEKNGVGKQSDYYCLGAVLYEMLIGQPPYFSEDIDKLYHNISHGKLFFPKSLRSQAKDILSKLLERNPKKRLGKNGIEQIKNHSFFKKVNWQSLLKKQIKAPTRPQNNEDQTWQSQRQLVKIIHKDFDYSGDNYRINRFVNFSFQRDKQEPIK